MQRPFEQLAPSNYRDRRARLARLREVVGEILGPHWEVHVKPGRRRIHLVCGESKPPTPAHKACEMNVTLWAHLWIDHLLGWARRWGHIAIFAAFKGEGRHKALKCEISKRSFRGGSKGGRVSRQRGARVRVKGGKGDRTRKGWGEVIRSDNLDWGLYDKKFSVWESLWTKQRGYIENEGVFVQAEQGIGMQCSRAWCGTPPILGVVNMVGTRNFTCYMGAL